MPAPSLPKVAYSGGTGGSGYLAAKVGGFESMVLVDSGAALSVIPKQVWLIATNGGSELMEHSGNVSAANGGGMGVVGRWQTVCQFEALALVAEFLVADIPSQDILLGFDFLSKYGAVIDFGEQTCRIMGKSLPLVVPKDSERPQPVAVQSDTVIPPRSEAIISGVVRNGFCEHAEGFLEPATSLSKHCDILVARVVCRVENGVVPVRVINVTEGPLPLKKGMRVGTLFTDIEVEKAGPEVGRGGGKGEPAPAWSVGALLSQFGIQERGLGSVEMRSVHELLQRHLPVFSTGDNDLGRTHLTWHQIDTGEARPVKLPPRRVPLHLQSEVADHIKQMQENDIIQPSCSPWAAPIVLVRKRDGSLRFCVDYRKLNDLTTKDAYPLPRIDDALDSLHNACWFSTLDLASGYWQVEVDPKDRHKTAFITRQGLFEFNVLSFGLCNSPGTFQRLMDLVLADLQWTTCLVYLDDIIVFGRTFQEHLLRLDEVLFKLRQANLKIKPSKCNLFATQVQYLGHVISADGVGVDPAKVQCVREWPVPKTQTEVRSFVGLASYYRRFVEGFAAVAQPLHQLTEKGRRFKWTEPCQQAFERLKIRLMTAPVLAYPDPHKPFTLDTDASDMGIGAVLSQEENGCERVIAYASRALTKQERKYATTKKELLSMVTFIKYFKHYLLGREFVLRTDHNSLRWLHNFQGLEGQLARWVEQLANFQYKIIHRPGKLHANADALSRLPAFAIEPAVGAFPCEDLGPELVPGPLIGAVQETASKTKSSQGRESDDLAQAQREDGEIWQLMQLKQSGGQAELPRDPALQRFAPVWAQLQVQGDRLVRVPPANSDAASQVQVVLPKAMIPSVLAQLHNTATGGHLGVQKLQGKIKDRFYWPGWFGDVRQWCRDCIDCASRKTQGRAPCAPLQPSVTSRPHERVALDILGPLPETADKNKYILVVGDYFSKWMEAFPLPNQEAHTIAKVLVEEWICRYGSPRSIHTDQGRNFDSNLFREMCRLLNVSKTRTSAYHPQSDGLVERFNRTLLSMLTLFVKDNQTNWDTLLPYVMLAYRSSVQATTGFSPYKVMFGREAVLPIDIMLNLDGRETFSSASEYVTRLADTLSTVVEAVKRHQVNASHQQKTAFDFRANFQYYSEGELVWMRNKARKRGVCPKLQRQFRGPYQVLERVTEVLYRVMLVEGGPEMVVHFNRLKSFLCSLPETRVARAGDGAPRKRPSNSRGPSDVPCGSTWVHHRPAMPAQAEPGTRGTGLPSQGPSEEGHHPVTVPTLEVAGPTGSAASGGCMEPQPLPVSASGTNSSAHTLNSSVEGAVGGPAPQETRPARQRRPPMWSRDYEMASR